MTSYTRARSCATRSGRRTFPSYTRSAAPSRTSSVARREGDISVKSRRRRATASSRTSAGAMRMASSSWAAPRRLVSAATGADAPRRRAPWTPGRVGPRTCARSYARSIGRSSDAAERPLELRLSAVGPIQASSSVPSADSEEARTLLCYAADATAAGPGSRTAPTRRARGRPAQEPPLPSLGHQDGARVRPDQDRLPPLQRRQPDFTNAPGHGDDDAATTGSQRTVLGGPPSTL